MYVYRMRVQSFLFDRRERERYIYIYNRDNDDYDVDGDDRRGLIAAGLAVEQRPGLLTVTRERPVAR